MGDFIFDENTGGYLYVDPTQVGPQPDGTVIQASSGLPSMPTDAGGGPANSYSQQTLDLFTKGLGGLTDLYKFNQMLDYRRFEATRTGVYQQGALAANTVVAQRQSSNLTLLILAGILVFALKG